MKNNGNRKKNNDIIFTKFKGKSKKQKVSQADAIKQAQDISRQMSESKEKARQDFMNALLRNAIEMNKAREDWEDKPEEEKEENE